MNWSNIRFLLLFLILWNTKVKRATYSTSGAAVNILDDLVMHESFCESAHRYPLPSTYTHLSKVKEALSLYCFNMLSHYPKMYLKMPRLPLCTPVENH